MSVWSAFWRELMTPDRFEGRPYEAFMNQVGHVAAGVVLAMAALALGDQVLGKAPNPWLVWPVVALGYAILIELSRQKWFGADTVLDSAFVSLGAVLIPASMTMTPSGRWFRVGLVRRFPVLAGLHHTGAGRLYLPATAASLWRHQ